MINKHKKINANNHATSPLAKVTSIFIAVFIFSMMLMRTSSIGRNYIS